MDTAIKYPIGIQTFSEIITEGYLYIDKTELIYRLVKENKYVFLSRPRRFGKSLLVSTIEEYFKGHKELFSGLAIARKETDWKKYPIIRFDFSGENYDDHTRLTELISAKLSNYEAIYGRNPEDKSIGMRFNRLIHNMRISSDERVVILIDEYDKPLLDVLHDDGKHELTRRELEGFYSNIKKCDADIRFALLTGVGKFGHVSIFSGLNNLNDISLMPRYNALCGISESEFHQCFAPSVTSFATTNGIDENETWALFKTKYDGYHFAKTGEDIYNPFSVLNAFAKEELGNYWFASGTPGFLVKIMKKNKSDLSDIEGVMLTEDDLSDLTNPAANYHALFFQAGYLTIKGYDKPTERYLLDFPNEEVRSGFWRSFYKQYVFDGTPRRTFDIFNFLDDIKQGNPEGFMTRIQALVAEISPGIDRGREVHFQNVMQIIFKMLGQMVHTEIESANSRCDMTVETPSYVYVMEFKINSSPLTAIAQIKSKGYAHRFVADQRTIFLIGANFSTATNELDSFLIEQFER